MLPLPAWIGIGGAVAGLLAGWTVRDWKADADALAASQAAQERYETRVDELAEQSLRFEELAQTIRANERVDRTTIREIYNEVEVPGECAAPDAAVSLLDNAVREANAAATGEPVSALPDTAPAAESAD